MGPLGIEVDGRNAQALEGNIQGAFLAPNPEHWTKHAEQKNTLMSVLAVAETMGVAKSAEAAVAAGRGGGRAAAAETGGGGGGGRGW